MHKDDERREERWARLSSQGWSRDAPIGQCIVEIVVVEGGTERRLREPVTTPPALPAEWVLDDTGNTLSVETLRWIAQSGTAVEAVDGMDWTAEGDTAVHWILLGDGTQFLARVARTPRKGVFGHE